VIVLCAIIRNEAANLLEWIAFHRVIGVDHFIFLDNESTDATRYILRPLESAGIITLVPWQTKERYLNFELESIGPQVPGYALALDIVRYARVWEWVGFIDLDEFLVPTTNATLLECLASVPNAAAIGINWHVFGSNYHIDRPSGNVIDNYTRRAHTNFAANKHVKTIARVDKIVKPGIHIPLVVNGLLLDMAGSSIDPRRDGIHESVVSSPLRVHHYFTKSRTDWNMKRLRGRVSKPLIDSEYVRNMTMFEEYDRNDVEDMTATRYSPQVIDEMTQLQQEIVRRAGGAMYRRLKGLP
jgi:hypothetical protein